jgi:hypothetical protein
VLLRDVDADHGAAHAAGQQLEPLGRVEQFGGLGERLLDHLLAQSAWHQPPGSRATGRRGPPGAVLHAARQCDGVQTPPGDHGMGVRRHDQPHLVPGSL